MRYEPDPLRSSAKRLLVEFDNRDMAGPRRSDVEEILRQVGGLVS